MIIERMEVLLEPWGDTYTGTRLRVRLRVYGQQERDVSLLLEGDHFETVFDRMFAAAREMLRKAVKDADKRKQETNPDRFADTPH